MPQPPAAAKRVDEALSELGAHEAVGDRVAAGRDERQQVDVVHGCRRDVRHGVGVVEHAPRVHDVHRRPADEEQHDHHGQHLDAAPLSADAADPCQSHVAAAVAAAAAATGADRLVTGGRRTAARLRHPSSTLLSRLRSRHELIVIACCAALLRFSSSAAKFRKPRPSHALYTQQLDLRSRVYDFGQRHR